MSRIVGGYLSFQAASLEYFVDLFSRSDEHHVDDLCIGLELIDDAVLSSGRRYRKAEQASMTLKRLS